MGKEPIAQTWFFIGVIPGVMGDIRVLRIFDGCANFLFFGKDFLQNGDYVPHLTELKSIIRPPTATLALGELRLPSAFKS